MFRTARVALFSALVVATVSTATVASAQSGSQDTNWREFLNDLYRLELAIDRCDQVLPSGSDLITLEDAIAYVERRADLPADALDEVYARLEYETVSDQAEFCAAMGNAVEDIRRIPANYRE